jgi:predicted phosphodiesterase
VVATLCDIHGEFVALQAVLREVPEGAMIVVGGDIVQGGPRPRETLECLQALGDRVHWVRGNHERALRALVEGADPGEFLADREGTAHTRAQLSPEQVAFLCELPLLVELDGIVYCHASPRNEVDIFTERTPEKRIAFIFEEVDADVVVCGHTHLQFDRGVAGRRIVNAGSVGAAYESEPGAYWLLDLEPQRTNYPGAARPDLTRQAWLNFVESLPHSL